MVTLTSTHDREQIQGELHTEQPIYSRAWILQEHFMSRRMRIYSKRRVFWRCGRLNGCYGRSQTSSSYTSSGAVTYILSKDLSDSDIIDWRIVAREYRRREVTDPRDKLTALSSIAAYFAGKTQDTYLAGLWLSNLALQLVWQCDIS